MRQFKRVIIVVCAVIFTIAPGYVQTAAEEFTVAGEIVFEKTGNVYVALVTEGEFEEHGHHGEKQDKEDPPAEMQDSPFRLLLSVGEEDIEAGKIAFAFEQVPAGTYAIRAFQDVNGNGKMDIGMFGPKEPWGNYRAKRPKFRGPKFEEMAFEVQENISDIQIELK